MSHLIKRHRAFVARGFAALLIVLTALLAIPLASPNFADDPPRDPPPPEDEQVSDSTDLDGQPRFGAMRVK